NANTDLGDYPEQAFDTVILSNSVQALLHPDEALQAALRIGKQAIVSFPNFGHWQLRWHLLTKGTMPQSRSLPATWYNTQNIHLCTIKDFITFAKERNFVIHKAYGLGADEQPRRFDPNQAFRANLFSEAALFILSRP
ncbi:MAG: methionine biosynthesis protein MetW, partial [Pseudomonadota bacterium]